MLGRLAQHLEREARVVVVELRVVRHAPNRLQQRACHIRHMAHRVSQLTERARCGFCGSAPRNYALCFSSVSRIHPTCIRRLSGRTESDRRLRFQDMLTAPFDSIDFDSRSILILEAF